MLTLPPGTRIYICHQPQDMHKSFDGLAADTVSLLKQAPGSGHYFVFLSCRRMHIFPLFMRFTRHVERALPVVPFE